MFGYHKFPQVDTVACIKSILFDKIRFITSTLTAYMKDSYIQEMTVQTFNEAA
jgi:hypothetical protein